MSYRRPPQPFPTNYGPLSDMVKGLLTDRVRKALALQSDSSRNKAPCLAAMEGNLQDVVILKIAKVVHEDMKSEIQRIQIKAEMVTMQIITAMNDLQAARERANRELKAGRKKPATTTASS